MARSSWINDESTPDLDAHVNKLEHFANSLADGVIDANALITHRFALAEADIALQTLDMNRGTVLKVLISAG